MAVASARRGAARKKRRNDAAPPNLRNSNSRHGTVPGLRAEGELGDRRLAAGGRAAFSSSGPADRGPVSDRIPDARRDPDRPLARMLRRHVSAARVVAAGVRLPDAVDGLRLYDGTGPPGL